MTFCKSKIRRNIAPRLKAMWQPYFEGMKIHVWSFAGGVNFYHLDKISVATSAYFWEIVFWNILENHKNKSISFMVKLPIATKLLFSLYRGLFGCPILCKYHFYTPITEKAIDRQKQIVKMVFFTSQNPQLNSEILL